MLKIHQYEQLARNHKRHLSDGLGDHYYLEQINYMMEECARYKEGMAPQHHRTESDPHFSKPHQKNDQFNGSKFHYSANVFRLIKDLLQVDDRKRITADEVLVKYHDWFKVNDAVIF